MIIGLHLCGETGIRTPEPLWTVTRFPGVPLQPLEHLSWLNNGQTRLSVVPLSSLLFIFR